jgi:FkbM family methyltransferase
MARKVAPAGRVWAFEPLADCRAVLVEAVSRVGLSEVVRARAEALGEWPGPSEFVVALDAPAYSGLRERIYDVPTRLERVHVEVVTLDGALSSETPVYIKVDAEGGEYHIFQGARDLLRRARPVVSFEFGLNSLGHYGVTPEDMESFWRAENYCLWNILGQPLDVPGAFSSSARTQSLWDYVAIPSERAGEAVRLFSGGVGDH